MIGYNARFYSPYLHRFTQPDSIIPDLTMPQAWDRYGYTLNNPIKYNDPTGHCPWCIGAAVGAIVGGIVGVATYAVNAKVSGQEFDAGEAIVAAGVGALAGGLIGSGIGMLSAGTVGGISAISGAATVSEVAGVTISTGAGIGSSGLGYVGSNIVTGSEFDPVDFSISSSVGAATGAAGPIWGTTRLASGAINGTASALEFELSYYHHNNSLDIGGGMASAAWGGMLGFAQPNTPIADFDLTSSSHPLANSHRYDPKFLSNKDVVLENLFGKPTARNFFRTVGSMALDELSPMELLESVLE